MRIMVVASHSAGHIWPAIAFCQGLKEKDNKVEIDFVSTDGEIEKKLLLNNFSSVLLFKKAQNTFLAVCNLITLFFRARAIIKKLNPDLVVGFGGYLSIPFIICAHFKKIPNFIHEQNFDIGLANQILARISDQAIFSFPNAQISDKLKSKSLFLGLPLRKELQHIEKKEAIRYFDLSENKFTLLVMGGSQGAVSINSQVLNILKNIDLTNMQVIHLTGLFDYPRVSRAYSDINIKNSVWSFLDNISYAFSACDLAVCRAGAGTVAEIVALRVPAILIPYPYAKLHQLNNARFLSDRNAAILINEGNSCEEVLREKIVDLKNNSDRLKQISQALGKVNMPNAREKMAELALSFVN